MDTLNSKLEKYRQALLDFLETESRIPASVGQIERQVIADEQRGQYLLVSNGWRGALHIDSIIYHFELKPDGKIWVHANWTDQLIDENLAERGVDPADLVAGFLPERVREMMAAS